jgi:hypothetical protein
MLPLRPDASGNYNKASFLTAGGIQSTVANPSPGNYVATALSRVDTMDLSGSTPRYSSRVTGSLNAPRWYGSGTLLPNGQVLTTSGADRDEVMTPGLEIPVRVAELFDPASRDVDPGRHAEPRAHLSQQRRVDARRPRTGRRPRADHDHVHDAALSR